MTSLQSRIFTLFIVLLLSVQVISFWSSYQANKRLEQQQLVSQLSKARAIFDAQFKSRNYYLGAFSQTAARDFGLIDNLEGDNRSFLVALNNHRQRIDADIAMAISQEGKIIGQLISVTDANGETKPARGKEQNSAFRYPSWLDFSEVNKFYSLDGRVFQLKLAPIRNGSTVIGWIGFGYLIDLALATEFFDLTGFDTGFVYKKQDLPVVISLSNQNVTADERYYIEQLVLNNRQDAQYISFSREIGDLDGQSLYVVMYRHKLDVLSTLEGFWFQLATIFMLSLTLSMVGAYAIARSVTNPIKQLIAQAKFIAKGNYESKVSVGKSRELTQLADEFTLMQHAVLSREQAIAHRAYHDPLTNLPNRNQLILTLAKMVELKTTPFALFLLNIRRLTDVNDTLGHHVGDEIIKEVAKRLQSIEDIDLVCHLSGDEFLVIDSLCKPHDVKIRAEILSKVIDAPYTYEKIELHLQTSIGVAFSDIASEANTLLQKADTAMHQCKKMKLPYYVYDREFDNHSIERLQLVNQLRNAIEMNELVLHYQPKLDLQTKKVTHVEALVRWQHGKNGLIPPDVFISIAEQTGQMHALTQWVMKEAARQYKSWQKQNITLSIAVNISAENFKDNDFCNQIFNIYQTFDLPLDAIILEITEDAVVEDPKLAIEILSYLRGHGIKISIDDYGTGYSSLAQLKKLPVHELKIDRAFVQHLLTDKDDRIIVESTIRLAHKLGLTVVAEGVEDEETLHWLADNHCEMAQGYFISKPLAAHELNRWLSETPFYNTTKVSQLKEV